MKDPLLNGTALVPTKLHARLGASSAHRWMACPGSIRMAEHVPTPGTSEYAQEGTAAHAVAELALRGGVDPVEFAGRVIEDVEVSDDMVENVRVFTNYVNEMIDKSSAHFIEFRFSLESLNPPEPMFGTADAVAYDAVEQELEVADLKFGRGVVVEVEGNEQTRVYALGAVLELHRLHPDWIIKKVKMTIVQPRASHPDGVIRSETIEIVDLFEFAGTLLEAAKKTQEPDAPLVPGPHCRFCPAAGLCPAQAQMAARLASIEFSDMTAGHAPPAPETLPDEVFYEILPHLDNLQDWLNAMWARLRDKMDRGEPTPGWKLVNKRANRSWIDEAHAAAVFKSQHGVKDDDLYQKKLRSPAQIEKIIGKKNFPAELTQKVSSGFNIAPADDPRPAAAISVADEFAALTDGQQSGE